VTELLLEYFLGGPMLTMAWTHADNGILGGGVPPTFLDRLQPEDKRFAQDVATILFDE
jgi:hypothetical protein